MEAQRYPADFDGIIAGAPAYDWTASRRRRSATCRRCSRIRRKLTPVFTPEDSQDGRIEDRRGVRHARRRQRRRHGRSAPQCKFDVDSLPLTRAEECGVESDLRADANRDGEIYPGQPFGGEGQTAGWPPGSPASRRRAARPRRACASLSEPASSSTSSLNDPDWDYSHTIWTTGRRTRRSPRRFSTRRIPTSSAFKARGGKLILWHGWADPALTPLASIRYHDQVQARDPKAATTFGCS